MKTIGTLILCLWTVLVSAQFEISGEIRSVNDGLPGAEISLYKMGSDQILGTVADDNGKFSIEGVPEGRYRLVAQYLGFQKYKQRITIGGDQVLPAIVLEEDVIEIDGVEITGTMIQAIQKGDTTVFNAEAFKTLPDADAKELIAKIPGIEIEGGTVKANGENVQRVTVDGKEFFGTDPNVALNALPAEIIQKIEVIDAKSEQAQFTGFDDGNTTKTINIVTKPDMRNGEFGKIYLGYGQDDRYQSGGNINVFSGDRRISFIGLSNNINQQNFSSDDLLGVLGGGGRRRGRGRRGRGGGDFLVGQQDGISTTHSLGVNFSDSWGDKTKFSGSYFFNQSDNELVQTIEQEYFSEREEGDIYSEDAARNTDNMNHRAQARIDINFNDKNSLRIRPRASWQGNEQEDLANTEFLRLGADADVANTIYNTESNALNLSNSLRYRHQFDKKGRTLSLSLGGSYNPTDGSSSLLTDLQRDSIDEPAQWSRDNGLSYGLEGEIGYTEPLGEQGQMMFDYEIEKDNGDDERLTSLGDTFEAGIQNAQLSNDQITEELTHTVSSAYRWRKDKTMIMARARVEHSQIGSTQTIPSDFETDKGYTRFLPFLMARMELTENSNLRVFYRPRTDNPSASQLAETVDNSNPLLLTKGDVNIEQAYIHSLFTRYSATNKSKGTVFYVFAGGDYSSDYIGTRTYLGGRNNPLYEALNIDPRAQLTVPENLGGYLNLRSYVTIGLPVTPIKSKLNFNIGGNYSETPGVIENETNSVSNSTLSLGVSLTSNISNNVDFTISSKTNLGSATNALQPLDDTDYLNQTSSLKLNVIFPYGITWRNQISHQLYSGYGDGFDNDYLLGVMSIGKKILKNDRGEISLSIFDLFNQNQAINRTVSSLYLESTTSNVLQRYIMLNFKYDLRHFGTPSKSSDREGRRGGRDGRPSRGGFHGGRG